MFCKKYRKDIFNTKIGEVPFNRHFPQYKGNPHEANEVIAWIIQQFSKIANENKTLYFHETTAIGTKKYF